MRDGERSEGVRKRRWRKEREKDREGQRDGEGRKGWRKLFPATANVKGGEF